MRDAYSIWTGGNVGYEYRNCVRMKCNLQQMRTKTALKVIWFALLYLSACLTCFPTANKCCLTKLAAITVVQDITVLQHSHRLSNISQTINIVSVKMGPSWHFYFAPFFILPTPWTGTRRPFSCPATDFRLDHLSFDSPDYVVVLCCLFTLGRCLDWNWNFTSAVLLNTVTFILPLETASRNSCSLQNIQIFQRIFFSLTLVFFSSAQWSFWFSSCDCKLDWPFRQRSSCFWHLRCQAKFIKCEECGQSF